MAHTAERIDHPAYLYFTVGVNYPSGRSFGDGVKYRSAERATESAAMAVREYGAASARVFGFYGPEPEDFREVECFTADQNDGPFPSTHGGPGIDPFQFLR